MMWVSSTSGARRRQSRAFKDGRFPAVCIKHFLTACAALGAALSFSAPSAADSVTLNKFLGYSSDLEVASDGSAYTSMKIPAQNLILDADIFIEGSSIFNTIRTYGVEAVIYYTDPETGEFNEYDPLEGLDVIVEPKNNRSWVRAVHRLRPIPYQDLAPRAVQLCNSLAESLRKKGMSDGEIFASDREIELWFGTLIFVEYSFVTSPRHYTRYPKEPFSLDKLICKKAPTRAPLKEIVTSALVVTETSNFSSCHLNTAGSITSLRANQSVSFRYVDEDGKKSAVKTVTTSPAKIANFTHQLPLAGDGGAMSGKLRMVGENLDFQSPWADYAVNCNVTAGAGDKTTELLPTIKILEAETIKEVIFGGRWACPSRVWLRGQVSGRGPGVAEVSLFEKDSTYDSLFGPKEFEVNQGSEEKFAAGHDISWQQFSASSGSPMSKEVSYLARIRMQTGTGESFVANEDEFDLTLKCRPVWPEVAIKVEVLTTGFYHRLGFVCPATYEVSAHLVGRSDAPVEVELYEGSEHLNSNTYDLSEGAEVNTPPRHRLVDWSKITPGLVNAVPQKAVEFSVKVSGNPGFHLVTEKKTEIFRCDPREEFVGDGSAQLPDPNPAPRVNVPFGQVRVVGGRVVLGGARPNSTYLLQFYFGGDSIGTFERATGPHLPTKARAGVVKLNRNAMQPGRWRVEVCATRGGKGNQILPGKCPTANFMVQDSQQNRAKQKKAAHSLKVHVAGGTIRLQGAQPNAVYLLQFHHQSKLGGKFKRVKASHLPTKALSGVAKVNLAKMTPGQWRVEVCATRGGKGTQMLPGSCIPGNFEVRQAAIGGFGGAFQ